MNQGASMAYNTQMTAVPPQESVMFPSSPSFMTSNGTNPMLQMGLQYGQNMIQHGLQQSKKEISPYMPYFLSTLHTYFAVDNEYVRRKFVLIFFPFLRSFKKPLGPEPNAIASDTAGSNTGFSDEVGTNNNHHGASAKISARVTPTQDRYVLDLYIPLMAAVTYIVICAFVFGLQHQNSVTQEYLFSTASVILFWCALETIALKLFVHLLQVVQWILILDIIALNGYKHVLVCTFVLLRQHTLMSDYRFLIPCLLYIIAANSFFTCKTIMYLCLRDDGRVPPRARFFSYLASALQIPALIWLCIRPFGL